jgi:ribosomal protein S18 acetylase RimI-like enzyme
MSSKRIYFRDVSQPFENSAAVRRWCVEYYDDAGTMFPVGMVWVAEIVGVGAQMSFVLVADEWRRNGIGKMLMESVKSRWPNIVATGPMGDSGKALLDSVGLNDVT